MTNIERRRSEIVNSALTYIAKSANLCKQYLDDNEIPVILEELNECVEQYCKQDIKLTTFNKALQLTENSFRDIDNVPDTSVEDTFKKFHAKEKVTSNKNSLSLHPFMIQYIRDIQETELEKEVENADDDIVASNSFVPPIDPITKTAIKNPVRNSQCGHVYENDSINALIKKKNTRCPYIGCPALQYIHITYLKPDNQLKKKIDYYFLNNA